MPQFLSDSFTDTAGTTLASHTGETGATWTRHPSYGTTTSQIASGNRLRGVAAINAVYYASGTPIDAEYDVEGIFYCHTDAGQMGVGGRIHTTDNDGYFARRSGTSWQLLKVDNGTQTSLGTYSDALSAGNTRTVKLEIRDAAKKVYVDGVLRITSTDNAVTVAGRAGIFGRSGASPGDSADTQLDSLTAVDAPTIVALGQATEADTVQALARLKAKALGQVTEADLAQVLRPLRTYGLGQVSETDLAQALSVSKRLAIGQVGESDSASVLTPLRRYLLGQAAETDLAQGLTVVRLRTLGQVSETDLAQAVTRGPRVIPLGQAVETDTAQLLGIAKRLGISAASETDIAQAVGHAKGYTLGQALEQSEAQALAHLKRLALGQVVETDLAQAVTGILFVTGRGSVTIVLAVVNPAALSQASLTSLTTTAESSTSLTTTSEVLA